MVLAVAEQGMQRAPSSRLLAAQADALVELDRPQHACLVLNTGRVKLSDSEVLSRAARIEDQFGGDAAGIYRLSAEAQVDAAKTVATLKRGLFVSFRDQDLAEAKWFSDQLTAQGQEGLTDWFPQKREQKGETRVPGGMKALAVFTRANLTTSSTSFFADYCTAIARDLSPHSHHKEWIELRLKQLLRYFETVRSLESFREQVGGPATITLSTESKASLQKTRKVLAMVGWNLRVKNGVYRVESKQDEDAVEKQEIALVLAIDELTIREALSSRESYTFTIPSDRVALLLGEDTWRRELFADEPSSGGFAEAVLRHPSIADTFVGLSSPPRNILHSLSCFLFSWIASHSKGIHKRRIPHGNFYSATIH